MWTTICLISLLLVSVIHADATAKRKVCVIGAGATGIASLKQFADRPEDFEPVAFDKNSDVGGLWIYTDSTTVDEHGLPVHSSMYKYLRTNLPKEIMAFPDYREFRGEDRSCVTHETVLQYLRNYTDQFNLRQYIQLNTLVEKVTPMPNDDWRKTKYIVATRNLNTNQTSETTCDAISVCNGHYFIARIPKIPGIESFPGRVMHSHVYRRPEDFDGQTVVVLGASASGVDLSIEISQRAKTVYLSHNKPRFTGHSLIAVGTFGNFFFPDRITSELPANVIQVAGVISANGSELTLKDGSKITVDGSFLFCTGYEFDYPFLDKKSTGIEVVDNHVRPLYRGLINVEHPTMAFIGLQLLVVHYPLFYVQSQYFVSLLQGKVDLPAKSAMLKDSARLPPGKPERYAHFLGDAQWAYNDELAKEGKFEPLPSLYKRGYEMWNAYRTAEIMRYKESNLVIRDDAGIEIVHPGVKDGGNKE